MKKFEKYLYPNIEPYETGYLKVDETHQIYYELSGNMNGQPILFVHGGPGGSTSPLCRRYFDPEYYKIVLFDQRGCGKSLPSLCLKKNTTFDLISDIEKLRNHLNIKKWVVFGGSWGSTLSLVYAINHPEVVTNLILRGIFLARKKDIDWLYQEGASFVKPLEYAQYVSILNSKQKKNILNSYHELMNSKDENVRTKALIEWERWEGSLLSINKEKFNEKDLKGISEIATIENYYFYNNCFFEENYILKNIKNIKDIPTFIVHGEYDLICPPSGAYDLYKKHPNSELFFIPKAAHTLREVGIAKKLVELTNNLRKK